MTRKHLTPERSVIDGINAEVALEREAQIARWGQQDHPSSYGEMDRRNAEQTADYWKQINAARVSMDCLTWDGILLEEVYEALAESDDTLRRQELIQVAAVATAEIEAIDRRLAAAITCEAAEGCGEVASCQEAGACLKADEEPAEEPAED